MNKILMTLTILAVGITAFSFVGYASAQAVAPQLPGNGPRGGNGNGTGVPMERNINLDGLLDDVMAVKIANQLGISVESLKSREAAGETLVEIGLSLGFDLETVLTIYSNARIEALTQAVAEGLISQDQADWLISRLEFGPYGVNAGPCTGDCTLGGQKMMRNGNRGNRPVAP